MRVGIFGGSFDPVHHGHLLVATALRELLELDVLRLVPVREQPLKIGQHRANPADRLAMVRMAVENTPELEVDSIEIDRPGPSFTVDTLATYQSRDPLTQPMLLIGADAARLFAAWREPERIQTLAQIVVFHRDGEEPPAIAGARLVAVPRIDISSTRVRDRVRLGKSIRYWVPDAVADYIATHRLYRDA